MVTHGVGQTAGIARRQYLAKTVSFFAAQNYSGNDPVDNCAHIHLISLLLLVLSKGTVGNGKAPAIDARCIEHGGY